MLEIVLLFNSFNVCCYVRPSTSYGLLRPITSCCVLLRPVTSCYILIHPVTSCYVVLRHFTSCHVVLRHFTSCHVLLRLGTSCYVLSHPIAQRYFKLFSRLYFYVFFSFYLIQFRQRVHIFQSYRQNYWNNISS